MADRKRQRVLETAITAIAETDTPEEFLSRVTEDEDAAELLADALEAASRVKDDRQRAALGRAVGEAIAGKRPVDDGARLTRSLGELTAADVNALIQLAAPDGNIDPQRTLDGFSDNSRDWPAPTLANLIRLGIASPATIVNGGIVLNAMTEHGWEVLEYLVHLPDNA